MIEYFLKYYDKLFGALLEHLEMVLITLVISLFIASILTLFAMYNKKVSKMLLGVFSMIYSIPSLALFALLIPMTGLGMAMGLSGEQGRPWCRRALGGTGLSTRVRRSSSSPAAGRSATGLGKVLTVWR